MLSILPRRARLWAAIVLCCVSGSVQSAEVSGYSVMKGRFLNQTGPGTLVLDPDFSYSFLASVDMPDFELVETASVRLPNGGQEELMELGDYWAQLESRESYSDLTAAYGWGRYVVDFTTMSEGRFSCELDFPNTTLPPNLRLVNFDQVQEVDASQPLILHYEFSSPPLSNDLMQVYINQGHAEIYSTPSLGEPGALDISQRAVTVPPYTLAPGAAYSLNLEITRLASTNTTAYPGGMGYAAVFSSTSVIITTLLPPWIRVPSPPEQGELTVEVLADPGRALVVQSADSFSSWRDLATNSAPSGTNTFKFIIGRQPSQFYRARYAD